MNARKSWAAVFAAVGLLATGAGLSRTVGAPAADRAPRVAVVNVARVANELKEKQDMDSRFTADGQQVATEEKRRVDTIRDLEGQRGNFRPDSPQYDDLLRKRAAAVAEYKSWTETVKFDQDLKKKRATMILDDKIAAAVAEYAAKNGIDIVVSQVSLNLTPRDFDGVSFPQLMGELQRRPVVYATKGSDISDEVILLLDSKYRAQGPGGGGPAGAAGQNATGGEITGAGATPR